MLVLVTAIAMQIEALMLLEELVFAKCTVPASELWQALLVPWGAAEQWMGAVLVGRLCREPGGEPLWREKLIFSKTNISTSSRHLYPSLFRKISKAMQFPCDF